MHVCMYACMCVCMHAEADEAGLDPKTSVLAERGGGRGRGQREGVLGEVRWSSTLAISRQHNGNLEGWRARGSGCKGEGSDETLSPTWQSRGSL